MRKKPLYDLSLNLPLLLFFHLLFHTYSVLTSQEGHPTRTDIKTTKGNTTIWTAVECSRIHMQRTNSNTVGCVHFRVLEYGMIKSPDTQLNGYQTRPDASFIFYMEHFYIAKAIIWHANSSDRWSRGTSEERTGLNQAPLGLRVRILLTK